MASASPLALSTAELASPTVSSRASRPDSSASSMASDAVSAQPSSSPWRSLSSNESSSGSASSSSSTPSTAASTSFMASVLTLASTDYPRLLDLNSAALPLSQSLASRMVTDPTDAISPSVSTMVQTTG